MTTHKLTGCRLLAVCTAFIVVALHGPRPCNAQPADTSAWRQSPFTIKDAASQAGWVSSSIDVAKWQPVDQPDLAEQLKNAPLLELEAVAPGPQSCRVDQMPFLVPNPDGKSWDMMYPYYQHYGGEQELVIHDFGTGQTRKQQLSMGKDAADPMARYRLEFHMQPSYYTNGKLVFGMGPPATFVVYDPVADAVTHVLLPFGDDVMMGRCVLGDDGMIYGMGWPKDRSGFVPFTFDPKTNTVERYKTFGPANENRTELYRDVVMSGDWFYGAFGNSPWHLVAFNFKTGEGRVLAVTQKIKGDKRTIKMGRVEGGILGSIQKAESITDVKDFDQKQFDFWLRDGKLLRCTGDVPPWSDKPAVFTGHPQFDWDREYQVWPRGFTPPSNIPSIAYDAADPDPRGHVVLSYHFEGQAPKKLEYDVKMHPGIVKEFIEVNDHVLFAADSGYGQHLFYNLKTKQLMRTRSTLSLYSVGLFNGRLYVSGYPGSQIQEYDVSRPIGLDQAQPNPRDLGYIGNHNETHCPIAGTFGGADGRIYNAGSDYGRKREGGGIGWYDPQTGDVGGIPVDGHLFFWMTDASDGRYMLLSSKLGSDGQLFCWDTQTHTFIYKKPVFETGRPGPIAEALPGGLVLGHHDGGALYGLNVATGEVLWRKEVGVRPVTNFKAIRWNRYAFRRGPDGFIWTFFDNVLVRIDPRDARVHVVGRVEEPSQLAFAGGNVYLAGGRDVRLIKNLRIANEN